MLYADAPSWWSTPTRRPTSSAGRPGGVRPRSCARCASTTPLARRRDRRAFVVVLDACGAGRDAGRRRVRRRGRRHARTPREGGRRARPADAGARWGWVGPGAARRRARRRPVAPRAPAPARPRQGLHDGPLGAHGGGRAGAAAGLPRRVPAGDRRAHRSGDGPRRPVQCRRQRHGGRSTTRGERHLETGDLIVYTSVDSVLQIAAHVDVVPPDELYGACAAVREIMSGDDAVGRVIARPFDGRAGRASPARTGVTTSPSPRRPQLPAGGPGSGRPRARRGEGRRPVRRRRGRPHPPGADQRGGHRRHDRAARDLDSGLVFVNLVETDQVYGHRKDVEGFHGALQRDRRRHGRVARALRPGDLLVLTADHGCDSPPPEPTTRANTSRCSRPSRATAAAVTTARWPTSGAIVPAWLTGRDAPDLPGRAFV